jgi:hypothetical protein
MAYLTLAELIRHGVPLSPAEAIALTLAVARVLDRRRADGDGVHVPDDERLLLSNAGDVIFGSVEGSTEQEEIFALASLLRRLLQLDARGAHDRRGRVPGGLLVVLARSLGQIDLPAPTREEFMTALTRFAGNESSSRALLSVIFWRAASLRPASEQSTHIAALLPALPPTFTERRTRGLSRTELRRAVRELEREVFEQASRVSAAQPGTAPEFHQRRAGVAGVLIAAMLVALLAASGASSPGALPRREPPGRFEAFSSPRSMPVVTRADIGRDAFSPSFGPKGQTLYFHAGRASAALMRASMQADGRVVRFSKLLDDGATNYHVSMSPNGQMIAFDSDRDGMRGVYIANANGRSARRISGGGFAAMPTWSPDGRRLAFARGEPSYPSVWNIWIANVGGGALQRVTSNPIGQPWGASWFPDGRRLAYSHDQRLVIVDLQTGRRTLIASPRPGHLVRTPAVSPDGSRVVFQVRGDGAWLLDVGRMRLRRFLPDPSAEDFVWAPDGRTVAYHALSDGAWGVWTIEL